MTSPPVPRMTLICSFGGGLGKTWFQRGYYGTTNAVKLRRTDPVIGEFLKSRGNGCLKESATARLPPIGSEV
jgi:hypothetical protein